MEFYITLLKLTLFALMETDCLLGCGISNSKEYVEYVILHNCLRRERERERELHVVAHTEDPTFIFIDVTQQVLPFSMLNHIQYCTSNIYAQVIRRNPYEILYSTIQLSTLSGKAYFTQKSNNLQQFTY